MAARLGERSCKINIMGVVVAAAVVVVVCCCCFGLLFWVVVLSSPLFLFRCWSLSDASMHTTHLNFPRAIHTLPRTPILIFPRPHAIHTLPSPRHSNPYLPHLALLSSRQLLHTHAIHTLPFTLPSPCTRHFLHFTFPTHAPLTHLYRTPFTPYLTT